MPALGEAGTGGPPAKAQPAGLRHLAPRAILTFAWPPTSLSMLLAGSVITWARGKEWKVRSDAPDAGLEQHLGAAWRHWGAQTWAQHCRHGLTSTEQRGRVTSLQLLAMLCPVQPRVPLSVFVKRAPCWLLFSLVSTGTSGAFSATLLSSSFAKLLWSQICVDVSLDASCLYQCHSQSVPPSFCRSHCFSENIF